MSRPGRALQEISELNEEVKRLGLMFGNVPISGNDVNGLGEPGKHGSIINRKYGSSFRLSMMTTDFPLVPDKLDNLG